MNTSETVTTAQINDLEDRRYAAMVEADLDTLDDLLSDDVIYTHSDASVDTKTSYLDMLRSGKLVLSGPRAHDGPRAHQAGGGDRRGHDVGPDPDARRREDPEQSGRRGVGHRGRAVAPRGVPAHADPGGS